MTRPVLALEGVSVRFGGIHAVNDVSLQVDGGRVSGLIGPNGAGKTTTFNVVTGLQRPTAGRVLLDGEDVTGLSPFRRARRGMARTFQRLEVFGTLTARDNVLVATEHHRDVSRDGSDPVRRADELLARLGLTGVAGRRADTLPTGQARLLELARALATKPRVLLLDEPGSGLGHEESDALGDLLLELASDGTAVLLVEHDVDLVMRVCSHVTVMDFGQVIAAGSAAEVQSSETVHAAYLGVA